MRFVVAGTGFGATHLQWLAECEQATVHALCYRTDRERAAELAGQWDVARISDDVHEVIAGGDVDALAVVSPPQTHEELIAAGLRAGLLVVSDKPLAADVAAARRLAEQARGTGGRAAVTFQWRANPALQRLRALCAGGDLGSVLRADLEFHHDFLAGSGTSWPWRHRRDTAGAGALGDQGVHLFDVLRWTVPGEWSVSAATALLAPQERHAPDGGTVVCETDDIAEVWLADAAGGRRARVLVSRISSGYRAVRVTLQGTAATALVQASPDSGEATLTVWAAGRSEPQVEQFAPDSMNPYRAVLATAAGEADGEQVAGFDDGLAAQVLLAEALERGAGTPQPVPHD